MKPLQKAKKPGYCYLDPCSSLHLLIWCSWVVSKGGIKLWFSEGIREIGHGWSPLITYWKRVDEGVFF